MSIENQDSPLQFPCEFPIKAFGRVDTDFNAVVADIVGRHVSQIPDTAITSRPSNGGKYIAVTITLMIESRAQLDAIYQDLSDSPAVIMAL